MDSLNIGVLGCANIAERSVIPAIIETEALNLVAVSSRTIARASEFASKFNCEAIEGYANLLARADVDVIYMPLPTGLHEEWVLKALEAGKHILVEKSLAMNYASAQKMLSVAKDKGLLIMENFMFLYHSQHDFVKKLLDDGEIGELRCFRSSFGFPPLDQENFRYDKALGGGSLLDAAAYTVRASQLFLGYELEVKAANLVVTSGQEVDIHGGAYLANQSGAFSEVAFGFDNFYQCNYELWGSKGKIIAQRAFTPGANFEPTITVEKQGESIDHKVEAENHFINILNEFARCVQSSDFEDKYIQIENQSRLLDQLRKLGTA